jgi:hypothetical protein
MRHRRYRLTLLALACTLFASGCTTTETFSVELANASTAPVTAWLTKEGGPDETDWLSPEALANAGVKRPELINGVVIAPGKTGTIGPIRGKFESGSIAILRVYAGQLSFDQILATSGPGELRQDVPLNAGLNELVVRPTPPFAVERRR